MQIIKDLVKYKGYCNKCGEPLGFIKDYEIFCYKCDGYKELNESDCIVECEKRLIELRRKFRNEIINGDAKKYLTIFLILGEGILSSESFKLSSVVQERG